MLNASLRTRVERLEEHAGADQKVNIAAELAAQIRAREQGVPLPEFDWEQDFEPDSIAAELRQRLATLEG